MDSVKGRRRLARDRQIVILKAAGETGEVSTEMLPLGSMAEVTEAFAAFNTADDGSGRKSGGAHLLHRAGVVGLRPALDGKDSQGLGTMRDEDLAWSVLWRLSRKNGWRMMDPNSGQTFG